MSELQALDAPTVDALKSKALAALAVYRDRGAAALAAPAHAAFASELARRDEAYHNFRALDAKLLAAGVDLTRVPEAHALLAEIQRLNATLANVLEEAKTQLGAKITKVRKGQLGAKAYKSGSASPAFLKRT
jgi:hypothetical protein